jgi:very-short-patch-repair endonuclease
MVRSAEDRMRRLFTSGEAAAVGLTSNALRWGEATGRWRRVRKGVYADGPDVPTALDHARAQVLARHAVASRGLAGVLHRLDGVGLDGHPVPRRQLAADQIVEVEGLRCTDGFQTMVDLAATLDDLAWEQALESALRNRLVTVADLERSLPALGRARVPGTARIRRVLERRPTGAPPTESLLETLMVQLARTVPGLPDPRRQVPIGTLRVDLAWPALGLFVELDGQQHLGQPLYDARRETAVVAATGWLCGRFTWTEVVRVPVSTARRLAQLADQARAGRWRHRRVFDASAAW